MFYDFTASKPVTGKMSSEIHIIGLYGTLAGI
jgi:hypothetical protein